MERTDSKTTQKENQKFGQLDIMGQEWSLNSKQDITITNYHIH